MEEKKEGRRKEGGRRESVVDDRGNAEETKATKKKRICPWIFPRRRQGPSYESLIFQFVESGIKSRFTSRRSCFRPSASILLESRRIARKIPVAVNRSDFLEIDR